MLYQFGWVSILTNSMHSHSWEANSSSANQGISRMLKKQKILLPCSQQPVTCLYLKLRIFSPHPPILDNNNNNNNNNNNLLLILLQSLNVLPLSTYNFHLLRSWMQLVQFFIFSFFISFIISSSHLFFGPYIPGSNDYLALFVQFYSPLSTSINQSGNPLSRFFSVNFFPWRGGWPRTKPPTWRTRVCIRSAPLHRLPSPRLWTPPI
jgi:hypothetical protein